MVLRFRDFQVVRAEMKCHQTGIKGKISETFAKTKGEVCEQYGRMPVIKRINKGYIQMQKVLVSAM